MTLQHLAHTQFFSPLQFNEADQFDSPLYWNVSAALDLSEMFEEATSFVGQGLQLWDVSNVQTTYGMVRNDQMHEQTFLLHIVVIFSLFLIQLFFIDDLLLHLF